MKRIKKILKGIKKWWNTDCLDTRKMSPGKKEMLLRIICR